MVISMTHSGTPYVCQLNCPCHHWTPVTHNATMIGGSSPLSSTSWSSGRRHTRAVHGVGETAACLDHGQPWKYHWLVSVGTMIPAANPTVSAHQREDARM